MLRVQETTTGSVLIHQVAPRLTVAAGWFAIVFGCVMLFRPTGWRSGTGQANPFIIFAIGLAITAFGCILALLRTTYLVDRSSDLLVKQSRLIRPLRATPYRLSDFTHVEAKHTTDSDGEGRYDLLLAGPGKVLKLQSAKTMAELQEARDAVALAVFGVAPKPAEQQDDDRDNE